MENHNQNFTIGTEAAVKDNSKRLLAASFSWMALALVISAIFAFLFREVEFLQSYLVNETYTGRSLSILGWVVMFAPLGLVILMSARVRKMSLPLLVTCFLLYSAIDGISLFFILSFYEIGSIINVFLSCVGLFGVFAVAGYFTKTDLSKLGSILFIGLIGIIIASLINMFMRSGTMDYIISFAGVVIFTGLTAYDVQKLKKMGSEAAAEGQAFGKMAIMGALTLYLDFINLFLFLLRLFGDRD